MTLEDLGSLGELIAAVATVMTLAYLAIQIRENTRALRAESRGRVSTLFHGFATVIGGNDQAASVFTRGLEDFNSRNSAEKNQFAFLFSMIVNQMHDAHLEYGFGNMTRAALEANSSNTLRLLKTPGGRDFWRLNALAFRSEFQQYVNEAIGEEAKADSD